MIVFHPVLMHIQFSHETKLSSIFYLESHHATRVDMFPEHGDAPGHVRSMRIQVFIEGQSLQSPRHYRMYIKSILMFS